MGCVYEIRGGRRLLCCDVCGHAGGVRRVSCRYGYCPATAMCAVLYIATLLVIAIFVFSQRDFK